MMTEKKLAAVPIRMTASKKNPSHQYLSHVKLILEDEGWLAKTSTTTRSFQFFTFQIANPRLLSNQIDWFGDLDGLDEDEDVKKLSALISILASIEFLAGNISRSL